MKLVVIGGTGQIGSRLVARFRDHGHDAVADPSARYFGTVPGERSLLPGDGAVIADTRFDDWLGLSRVGR